MQSLQAELIIHIEGGYFSFIEMQLSQLFNNKWCLLKKFKDELQFELKNKEVFSLISSGTVET